MLTYGVDESRKFGGSLVGRLIDDALFGEYTSSHGGIESEISEPGKRELPKTRKTGSAMDVDGPIGLCGEGRDCRGLSLFSFCVFRVFRVFRVSSLV